MWTQEAQARGRPRGRSEWAATPLAGWRQHQRDVMSSSHPRLMLPHDLGRVKLNFSRGPTRVRDAGSRVATDVIARCSVTPQPGLAFDGQFAGWYALANAAGLCDQRPAG